MARFTALALALTVAPTAAFAGELDLEPWLSRPGVRLVAVELHASWCEPCKAAAPKWRALREKYRSRGLRVIAVATQDPAGCLTQPFEADQAICDEDGHLAARLGANPLPAGYLWSWQGSLLAEHAEVDAIEVKVEAALRDSPRVALEVSDLGKTKLDRRALRAMVRARLTESDKLVVVADEEERKRLDAVAAESFRARYDEAAHCEVGKALPANSLLDVRVTSEARPRLSLSLFSAETHCLVASALAELREDKPETSVAEASAALLSGLAKKVELPGAAVKPRGATEAAAATKASEGLEVVTRAPDKLAVRAVGHAKPGARDALSKLQWAKRDARARAIEAASELLQAAPYGLTRDTAKARAEAGEEAYAIEEDGVTLVLTIRP